MLIRPERPADRGAVHRLNALAFAQPDEAELVVRLQDQGFALLSLVAELEGRLLGHILFTRLPVVDEQGVRWPAVALAPMAVHPEVQRGGVGSALVREGLRRLAEGGEGAVVVLGHPDYYPRFGFSPATAERLRAPWSGPAFMALELRPGALPAGEPIYAAPFFDPPEVGADLAALRAALDEVDRGLVELAATRGALVGRVGALKARDGGALFDRAREREVYDRARRNAGEAGLRPAMAEALLGVLVEASHQGQEAVVAAPSKPARDVLIVGGEGRMGRRFAEALASLGHRVRSLEPGDGQDPAAAVAAAEVVMLSVPMALAARVARELGPHLRPDALLCDINSLKAEVCAAMAESAAGEVVGLHPMFGPTVATFRRQKVVVCRVRGGARVDWLLGELDRLGLERVEAAPEEHDRMMGVVQVLVHHSTLVMGEALRRSGVDLRRSLAFTSPIYRLELAFVGRLFAQSPALYAEIEMSNPHGPALREGFREATERLTALVDAGDREGFLALFRGVAAWFDGFEDEAMRLSDTVIDGLVARP